MCIASRLVVIALTLMSLIGSAQALNITVSWTHAVTPPNVDGYIVYWGTTSHNYPNHQEVGYINQVTLGGFAYDVTYYFSATAFNKAGESVYATEASLTTPTPMVDTELPIVLITSPSHDSTMTPKSQVTIAVEATDNLGVVSVEITVTGGDGQNANVLCTRNQKPYSCPWKVPAGKHKKYILEAMARDAAGNIGSSPSVTVKVP